MYGGILGSGLDFKKQNENKLNLQQRQKEAHEIIKARNFAEQAAAKEAAQN